jgi:hypothetical protein
VRHGRSLPRSWRLCERGFSGVERIQLAEIREDLPTEDQGFIRYWFPQGAQKQLFALSSAIAKEPAGPGQDLAWVIFSSLIIAKSVGASFALDLARSRPHKSERKPVVLPFTAWDRRFRATVARLPFVDRPGAPNARVGSGDARSLPIAEGSADLVLTSPPYLNAIDYVRSHKFSLLWMGHSLEELRELRGAMVGTERGMWSPDGVPQPLEDRLVRSDVEDRRRALLRKYLSDLRRSDAVSTVATLCDGLGLKVIGHAARTLSARRRSLPPPSLARGNPLADRMRREIVVALRK